MKKICYFSFIVILCAITLAVISCTHLSKDPQESSSPVISSQETECPHSNLSTSTVTQNCTSWGYTLYECICGYSYKDDIVPALGHNYSESVTVATCESEGNVVLTCNTCAHSVKSDIISALGHDFKSTVFSPSCYDQGYTEYKCSRCDTSFISDYLPATGHTLNITHISHPTADKSGTLTQKCLSCEYSFTNFLKYNDVYQNAYTENTAFLGKGVDISYHNHKPSNTVACGYDHLNWGAIKSAGFDFAILRAGYTGFKDPVFEMNYADAKAIGMELGVYYYTYAKSAEEAIDEAEELISWLKGKRFEYPIYYDIEDDSLTNLDKDTITEMCTAFVDTLRSEGYYGAVYSNNNWLTNYINANELKGYCDIWYARYPKDPVADSEAFLTFTVLPENNEFVWLEKYGKQLGMWQYTQCGIIEGSNIYNKVDFNYVFKDYPSFIKRLGFNGYMPEQ